MLLRGEGQVRDALTAFELAADSARLVGLSEELRESDEFDAIAFAAHMKAHPPLPSFSFFIIKMSSF